MNTWVCDCNLCAHFLVTLANEGGEDGLQASATALENKPFLPHVVAAQRQTCFLDDAQFKYPVVAGVGIGSRSFPLLFFHRIVVWLLDAGHPI